MAVDSDEGLVHFRPIAAVRNNVLTLQNFEILPKMNGLPESTNGLRSIGGVLLILAGGVGLMLSIALAFTGVWVCFDGKVFSGHLPGALFIFQAAIVGFLARWAFLRGLKIQAALQNIDTN